jgi:AraC-like DNA-binding protein
MHWIQITLKHSGRKVKNSSKSRFSHYSAYFPKSRSPLATNPQAPTKAFKKIMGCSPRQYSGGRNSGSPACSEGEGARADGLRQQNCMVNVQYLRQSESTGMSLEYAQEESE